MIPYTTFHTFDEDIYLPPEDAFFHKPLFSMLEDDDLHPKMLDDMLPDVLKTDICGDFPEIDLDTLFPEEQLSSADDYDDIENKIYYAETAEDAVPPITHYLRQNCKWTGCDEECAKTHWKHVSADSFADVELNNERLIIPNMLFCDDDSMDDESHITYSGSAQPYTPDSDHCYSQPVHMYTTNEESDRTVQDSVDSDSASESSDDEVDVVTVTEDCNNAVIQRYVDQPIRAPAIRTAHIKAVQSVRSLSVRSNQTNRISQTVKVTQNRGIRQRYAQRKSTQRTRNNATSTVKAAASALKRTHKYQSKMPNKRRKMSNSVETSPSSSLPSSCVNSDMEDYEKRSTHNDSERKRREAQRTALQMLRVCIPELHSNLKAPKVLILNTAAKLVNRLQADSQSQAEQLKIELKRRKRLQDRLKELTSN